MSKSLINTTFTLLLATSSSYASVSPPSSTADSQTRTRIKAKVEKTHERISNKVINFSLKLDRRLGDSNSLEETSDTFVTMKMLSVSSRHKGRKFKTKFNSQISLPQTEKRMQIFVNNLKDEYKHNSIETIEEHSDNNVGSNNSSDDDLATGIRQRLVQSDIFHLHADVGAKFNIPLDPFVKIKSRQSFEAKKIALHFTQEGHSYKHSGYGYSFGLRLDTHFIQDYHFRFTNVSSYHNTHDFHKIQNGLSLVHTLDHHRSFTYFANSTGESEPTLHVTAYNFGLSYRQNLNWPWMIVKLTPMINHNIDNSFTPNPGFVVQLETTFGAI